MRLSKYLSILCLLLMWGFLSSFNYQDEWKALEKEANRNPKTALAKLETIEKQAKSDKNLPQQLRCILSRYQFSEVRDEDALETCISNLQKFQAHQSDPVAVAMARFVESLAFNDFMENNEWDLDARTRLEGVVPADMKEWSINIFEDTIRALQHKAIEEPKLKKTKAEVYEPLLNLGDDSRLYRPTLYDFLVYYCIDNEQHIYDSEISAFYENLKEFHKNDADKSAYVQACLGDIMDHIEGEALIEALQNLLKENLSSPASILVRIDLAQTLYGQIEADNSAGNPETILKICNDGIAAFPKHPKTPCLKALIQKVNRAEFRLTVNSIFHTGDSIRFSLSYANISPFKATLYRYKCTADEWRTKNHDKLDKVKVGDFSFPVEKSIYFISRDTVLELPAQPLGAYVLVSEKQQVEFIVSDEFPLVSRCLDNGKNNIFILDSKTGAPRPGVTVDVFNGYRSPEKVISAESDKDGFVQMALKDQNYFFQFVEGNDHYQNRSFYLSENCVTASNNASELEISIFTDRSLYRPGQTLYFKAVALQIAEKATQVIANKELDVALYDANSQKLGEMKLTTNEFGSVASSFVLPANGLSGEYHLQVGRKYLYFSVEEYKRPSFEVTLDKPKTVYTYGDSVSVNGSAGYLLGTPVQGAKVAYTIERRQNNSFFWWRNGLYSDEVFAFDGETTTDAEGNFSISFVPQKGLKEKNVCYDFYITAKVTDANGETHEQTLLITVDDEPMFVSCPNVESVLFDDLSKTKFAVVNLNSEAVAREVTYKAFCNGVEVASGKLQSSATEGFTLPFDNDKFKSGAYKVQFSITDDHGKVISRDFGTILYRKTDVKPPVETDIWKEDFDTYNVDYGEKKTVRFGSSLLDAHVLILSYNDKGLVKKEWVSLDNEIKSFTFSLDKGLACQYDFFLVHNGKMYLGELTLCHKEPSKDLPVKLAVFRDKVQPGAKEKWSITIPSKKSAEVLATMYDASLDQIKNYGWHFSPEYKQTVNFPFWSGLRNGDENRYMYYSQSITGNLYTSFYYDSWKDFFSSYGSRSRSRGMVFMKSCNVVTFSADVDEALQGKVCGVAALNTDKYVVAEDEVDEELAYPASEQGNVPPPPPPAPLKVRSNFAETAFFYPQLSTDKDGNVQLNFTMPESLTRWKLMALAHTKDLFYGQLSQEVVSQKDFMVSPNYPRFLRHGDACVLSAKVVNLSDAAQSGTAKLQLLDPVTEKVIIEKSTSFAIGAGKNGAVEWPVEIPDTVDAVLVRVSGVSGNFSDAEQKLLPVLSSRVVLTQSLPMYVRGGQTKDYTFSKLVENNSNTLTSRFLKLEMATNPIWYAVQSLPSVATVEHENAISLSAAYFASQLANKIATSNPKIFKVIELWKQQSADKETLLSNLEKNQEVKNVLLNETPWVMDAKSETERKQRLATLFDVNSLSSNCDNWLKKLNDLQTEEGGYAWFKGMKAGLHSTLFVLDNLGRLKKAGIDISAQNVNISKALAFADKRIKEDYDWLVKYDKDYKTHATIGMYELYYFQVRSLFADVKLTSGCKEAYDFYYGLMKKQWDSCSLNGKALAAISLYRGGDKEESKKVIRSLREYSTSTDEMGMYWQKNESGYFWQDAAISTHTRIMEALQLIDNNQAEQDDLRIWLLNQKRTQNWDNVIANVDALNVLLLNGSDWLGHENNVSVAMAGTKVQPESAEVGTGYFAKVVPGKDVKPEMGKLRLASAQGDNLSWGAVYWQFEEDIDKVQSNKTGLHIEKSVMLKAVSGDKEVLQPITANTQLKVGDKLVVRLVLRTDRDLEYVSLKDQRASCLEPVQQLSGYRYSDGTGYYQSAKDAAMYYFFDHLSKGTYVFEYPLYVTNKGDFSNGITTVQCLYAPEFSTNTGSVRIKVEK